MQNVITDTQNNHKGDREQPRASCCRICGPLFYEKRSTCLFDFSLLIWGRHICFESDTESQQLKIFSIIHETEDFITQLSGRVFGVLAFE